MKVHCLYRDFFLFLRALDLERDPWHAFQRYYFEPHRDFLSTVWFEHQGFTRKNIRERVAAVKKKDYAHLENALKLFDIEEETRTVIMHCKRVYYHPGQCNVYLFIGFFSPDAFVLLQGGDAVICVGLERFRDFSRYPLLMAHEYFHYVQKKTDRGEPCVGSAREMRGSPAVTNPEAVLDSLIEEGLCVYFSRLAYPRRKEHEHCFLSEQRHRQLEEEFPDIVGRLRSANMSLDQLFTSHQEKLPGRAGYYLGYRLVADFAEKTGARDLDTLLSSRRRIVLDFTGA